MNNTLKYKWQLEVLFLLITAIITFIIVYPVQSYFESRFPFINTNCFIVFIFLTQARYLFLLRLTPFSHSHIVKLVLLFICIPLLLYVVDQFYEFQNFVDVGKMEEIVLSNESLVRSHQMIKYTTYEMIFFLSGLFITAIITPFRMVVSIWKVVNKRDTV